MIAIVEQSAVLRDGKTAVKVGDLVRIELNKNVWQIVAISGEYTVNRNFQTGELETVKPYRKFMARKLFNAKGVFKPSQYAEVVHYGWVYVPRKDKLEEMNKYFAEHPQDKAVADDLTKVQPESCGCVEGLAKFNGVDAKVAVEEMRAELGSTFTYNDFKRVIAKWVEIGKVEIYQNIDITQDIKNNYPYRIFACGYDGYYNENCDGLYLTVGVDNSAEETNYWFNVKNARKAIKEAGKEINGVFNVF